MRIFRKTKPSTARRGARGALLALALAGCVTYTGPRSNFIVPKEALYVTGPDAQNRVEVGGSIRFREYTPRFVTYAIRNKNSGATVEGSLTPGHQFKDSIAAGVHDKIKVTFTDDRGKTKSRTLKVPASRRAR